MGFLSTFGGVLLDALKNPAQAGSSNVTFDDLINVVEYIQLESQVIDGVFNNADRLMRDALSHARAAGEDVATVAQDLKLITHHTYEVVIPQSMSWFRGEIIRTLIDPLRARIAQLQHQVDFLMGWRGQIDNWRHNWVDPNINDWRTFHAFFNTWPLQVLTTWHRWFADPHEFGVWAATPIIGPLIGYLADNNHETTRDNLSLIMVRAWSERPEQTWQAVMTWLVTD